MFANTVTKTVCRRGLCNLSKSSHFIRNSRYLLRSRHSLYRANGYTTASSRVPRIVHDNGSGLVSLSCPNGEELKLSHFYLRDHCSCPECKHPDTKQRLVDTFSIPENIGPKEISQLEDGISITWANDEHKSFYPWKWLQVRNKNPKFQSEIALWDASIAKNPPTIDYASVMKSDDGVREWTSLIKKWGFCYVDGCPVTGEATKELIERIAFIRNTHYGDFWQFTADLSKKDSAYTNLALPAHTDTTYFTDPAGLQTFHLLSHTSGHGGLSLLIDGFHAAHHLKLSSPESYNTLSRIKIRGHASGNANTKFLTEKSFPVFDVDEEGELRQVRWNNDDRAALVVGDVGEVEMWYGAARKWVEVLRRRELEYWEGLRPGRVLIFDNWRVLHGRSAFTGKRTMCGGYTNMDDFISRWKTLNFGEKEIMNSV